MAIDKFESDELQNALSRLNQMRKNKLEYFFDVFEYELLIEHFIETGNLFEANNIVKLAIKQHPNSYDIKLKKAQILIENNYPGKALKILSKIADQNNNNYELLLLRGIANTKLGDVKKAIENFERALQLGYEDKLELLYQISQTFFLVGQFEIAVRYLRKGLLIDDSNLQVLYDLAFCLEKINQDDESAKIYEKYLDINPFSDFAWYNLGVIYNKLGKSEKSLKAYEFALALNEKLSSALFNKGNLLVKLGMYNEAIETYKEFLDLEPDSATVSCFIGECYEFLDHFDLALQYYQKSISLDRKCADAWYGVGIIHLYDENYHQCLDCFKKATEFEPRNPGYWYILGQVNEKLNNEIDAEISYRKAVQIEPFKHEFWLSYSDLVYRKKNIKRAIRILQEASEYISENAEINYRLAAFLFREGKPLVAFNHLKTALEIDYNQHDTFFKFYPQAEINFTIKKMIAKYNRLVKVE